MSLALILRFICISCFSVCIGSYSVLPQRWTLNPSLRSSHCNVSIGSVSANLTLDENCVIERDLSHSTVAASVCSDDSYYKLSLMVRFIITNIDQSSEDINSGTKVYQITLGKMIVLKIIIVVDLLARVAMMSEQQIGSWESKIAYIENNAGYLDSETLFFRENVTIAVNGVSGYLEINDFKMECVPPRSKHIIRVGDSSRTANKEDYCSLSGTPHARLISRRNIDTRRTMIQQDGELYALQEPTVLCSIYTYHAHHANVVAIRDTWGRKCTGFLAFSDVEDLTIPTIHIPHVGGEDYRNMWQKVRAMLQYVNIHYRDEYDYFLFGGDDMYYVMENLYAYLSSGEIREQRDKANGVYLGRQYLHPDKTLFYNTGGPGYLLDSIALQKFGSTLIHCLPELDASIEDMVVAFCLKYIHGITPHKTTDDHGRHRWHNFPPAYLIAPNSSAFTPKAVELSYDPSLLYGEECCSQYSIAFHNINRDLMYALDNLLYRCEENLKGKL